MFTQEQDLRNFISRLQAMYVKLLIVCFFGTHLPKTYETLQVYNSNHTRPCNHVAVHMTRRGNRNNSGIISHISPIKHIL